MQCMYKAYPDLQLELKGGVHICLWHRFVQCAASTKRIVVSLYNLMAKHFICRPHRRLSFSEMLVWTGACTYYKSSVDHVFCLWPCLAMSNWRLYYRG